MKECFVDAWFMIALLDRGDHHHVQAARMRERLRHVPLLTHEGVLFEVLAFFAASGRLGRTTAMAMVRRAQAEWTVISITPNLFDAALALYAARPDKEYSLTDCMSMIVMRNRGIEHVLTNDHHFRQEGFTVLSE